MDKLCRLCPRDCALPRPETARGATGACGMGTTPRVARAALHFGEEPCISGTRGSGTVFFSGCALRCVFCQNAPISAQGFGREVTPARLREIYQALLAQGAHNINLVTPSHFVPAVRASLTPRLSAPVCYNTSAYDREEALRSLEGLVDIYLPDMKYRSPVLAERYSGAADYPSVADRAIREMFRQTGPFVLGEDGLLRRGVLIRHLMLPGALQDTLDVIDWVAETFPRNSVLFSLLWQYTPPDRPLPYPELAARVAEEDYALAARYLSLRGIEAGFLQEKEAACNEFLPSFDLTGVEET